MRLLAVLPWFAIGTLAWAAPPVQTAPPAARPAQQAIQYHSGQGSLSVVPAQTPPGSGNAPAPAASPGDVPSSGDDSVDELNRIRAEEQKAWATINGNNPFSASFGGEGAQGAGAGTGPFEQMNKILSQPMVQGYMRFFANPIFSKGVEQVMKSPQRMTLLYVQLGFIVFMLIFRAWRFSKSAHWAARLWTKAWTTILYLVCSAVVIPWVVLGDPYYQTIRGALDVLLTSRK